MREQSEKQEVASEPGKAIEPLEKPEETEVRPDIEAVGKTPETRRRYFKMFDAFAVRNLPVHEIAKEFGVSKSSVYLALDWVKANTPDVSDITHQLAAVRSKQANIKEWKEDRIAVREWLRKQREGGLSDEEKKVKYSYKTLYEMDAHIANEEEKLYTYLGIVERNVLTLKGKLETEDKGLGQLIPEIMSFLREQRPKLKKDVPDPEHQLQPEQPASEAPAPDNG